MVDAGHRGRLGRETENPGGPADAQHIGVADAVAAGQRGGDQRPHLVVSRAAAKRTTGRSKTVLLG